jgi:hypothetical protein
MIIIGTENEIAMIKHDRAGLLASLLVAVSLENGHIIKDRFSKIGDRYVDFPEMGHILAAHFSVMEKELALDK